MRQPRSGLLLLCVAGAAACEPTQVAAPPQPPPVVLAPAVEPSTTAAVGPDLSPVAEPADIIGLGRWRSPMATASNLASCAGVAPIIVEVNARMGVDMILRNFIRSGDTRKLAAVVALDAPVDVLAVLDADERARPPHYALALGLTSLDGAKIAVGAGDAELAPGLWHVKGARGFACGVAASAGATPARLVCADREKTLTALTPYLARTLPGVDLGAADVRVEARLDVLDMRYGDSLRKSLRALPGSLTSEYGIENTRFDRALFEAGVDVQQDIASFLGDARRITAEVRSESSGTCLRTRLEADLRDRQSWLAQALTDRLDRSGPPPALFWRLPKDSDMAFYDRGVDPARFTTVIKRLREMLDAALAAEGLGAADRKKLTDLINMPYSKDTVSVMSYGGVNVPFPSAGTRDAERKLVEAGFAGLMGWTMVGVDRGAPTLKKQLKSLVDAYKAAGVQSALKKEMGSDAKHLPVVKTAPAPAALGVGAEALEITIPNIPVPPPRNAQRPQAPKTTSLNLHVLLMVDGDGAWLAMGAVKDELVKRLVAAKTGASARDQLASRADMEPLRTGKQMSGGFLSAATFTRQVSTAVTAMDAIDPGVLGQDMLSLARSLTTLPNRGQTPLFITTDGTSDATSMKVSLTMEAQQGTFEDARALVVSSYGFLSRLGFLP